MAFVLVL